MMKKVMRVFMKSLLCGVLPFCLLLGGLSVSAYTGSSAKALTAGADIRVMSYNVLVDNDESLGGWSWGQALGTRGDKASAAIAYYQPDVIGFQECNYKWHVSLRENLPDYDFVNADVPEEQKLEAKESLGKKDWMCTTMMYNTKTLELVYNELVGYPVNYWGCIQRMRYLSMAVFKVKKTGELFIFTSTHLDAEKDTKGEKMRERQANEMVKLLNNYKNTYGYPIISTGDFNSGYNDTPIKKLRDDADMDSYKDNRGGIDYVLYSQGVSCKYFTVVNDADLRGASDHQPIFADLALQDNFSFPTTGTTQSTTTTTTTARPTTTTTLPSAFKPTKATTSAGTTTATVTTKKTDAPAVDPTTQATAAPTQVTDAPIVDVPTTGTEVADPTDAPTSTTEPIYGPGVEGDDIVSTTSATAAPEVEDDSEKVEADIVKKGNDTLLYIGIAAAVVLIGAGIAFVLLRKKK